MVIGACTVELLVPGSESLKDKRQVIKSLLARLHNKYNISASEVEQQDNRRRATIGLACVTNDSAFAHEMLTRAIGLMESEPRVSVEDYEIEIL